MGGTTTYRIELEMTVDSQYPNPRAWDWNALMDFDGDREKVSIKKVRIKNDYLR